MPRLAERHFFTMQTHYSFEDTEDESRILEAYINKDNYLFVSTPCDGNRDYNGFVILDQQELDLFINHLQRLRDNVKPTNNG